MSAPRRRDLFDVRLMIAGLMGLYGIILTIMGIGASTQSLHKADGIRINLWVGLSMLAVAVLFLVWARLRPLERDPGTSQEPTDPD